MSCTPSIPSSLAATPGSSVDNAGGSLAIRKRLDAYCRLRAGSIADLSPSCVIDLELIHG
jgi:hypothetical protein